MIDALAETGGAEQSLVLFAPRLREHSIESEFVCLGGRPSDLQQRLVDQGFVVRTLASRSWLLRVLELRQLIGRNSPDLVHASMVYSCLATRIAMAGSGIPRLDSLVNTTYDPIRSSRLGVASWRLAVLRLLDVVTAVLSKGSYHALTSAVAEEARRALRVPRDRITIIPRGRSASELGARTAERESAARRSLGLPLSAFVVVTCGRQDHQKGQSVLVEAFHRVVQSIPSAQLVIAGRAGSETPQIEELIRKLGLERHVHCLGHRSDVGEILCAADVFAFPSLYEGLGGAVIEAMALEVPIVASDAPALVELLDSGRLGSLVPRGDAVALAKEIVAVLENPQAAAVRVAAARSRFLSEYELESVSQRMADLYRRVVGA